MRKLALALLIVALSAGAASAMDMAARTFYIHGVFSLPTGNFGDFAGNGFGGGVGISVPHNDMLNFRGEVGYIMFAGESYDYGTYSWDYSYSMIPIVALAEYHFNPDTPLYGLGGAGLFMSRFSVEGEEPITGTTFDNSDSSTDFGLSLGAGFGVNEKFSVEGRYNIISDANQFTVNVIFRF
jgi:opacity protein-like surface antigen